MTTAAPPQLTRSRNRRLFDDVGMPDYDLWPDVPRCMSADPETFFPPKGASPAPAKAICASCPVVEPCLQHALTVPSCDDFGIWGGTSERERVQLRQSMGRSGVRSRWAA